MELSVIIVNWKVKDLLRQCLKSVFEKTDGLSFEVFVVDNNSGDGSVEMVAKEFPEVTLIASNQNLGFAKGNNEAIRQAVGEFVLLLNPDTEIEGNALYQLVAFAKRHPQAGIIGPKLINTDGSHQPSVRRFPDLWSQILLMLKVPILWPKLKSLERRQAIDFDYSKTQPCDMVMGATFLINPSVLDKIGVLDERYFIWFEEVDYCKMATDAGFEVWYTPEIVVTHHQAESFGQVFGPLKQKMFDESARKYFRKHYGFWSWIVLFMLRPLSAFLSWLAVLPKKIIKKRIRV